MRRAKQFLETTFLSVKEIMTVVGLQDESHFVRDFKTVYGIPPGAYRKRRLLSTSTDLTTKSANE